MNHKQTNMFGIHNILQTIQKYTLLSSQVNVNCPACLIILLFTCYIQINRYRETGIMFALISFPSKGTLGSPCAQDYTGCNKNVVGNFTPVKFFPTVFISNCNIFHWEWLRVPHCSPNRAPC
jgi:hypothetical protein